MDLRENWSIDEALEHWYYQSKFRMVKKVLPWLSVRDCLDYGCGRGVFSVLVKREYPDVSVTGYDPGGPEIRENGVVFTNRSPECPADVILLMDVLEHCPDPKAVLADVRRLCRENTRILVTVPAFQWLWSEHDVFLKHYRRYRLKELELLAGEGGFEVQQGFYLYSHLVLPAFLRRRCLPYTPSEQGPMKENSQPLVQKVLSFVGKLDLAFSSWNRLGGLSVCAVLKPQAGK